MTEVIEKIQRLPEHALREVMKAIEQRYAESYPDWDVVYMAMHKDPVLRRQEFANIAKLLDIDTAEQ